MFGLIIPNYKTLNEDQKSRYQSVYCGLCHSLRDKYSNISRLALSFDLTFLVLLLSSLYEPEEKSENCNCIFHPGKKYSTAQNEFSDYCADATVALAYHKLVDDINDEEKTIAKIGKKALDSQYKKVQAANPRMTEKIDYYMKEILKAEDNANDNSAADNIAMNFGMIMAELFTPYNDMWNEDLAKFGANLGRLIYFMDAAMDFEKDKKSGAFNPLRYFYDDDSLSAQNVRDIKKQLTTIAGLATQHFEKLPLVQDVDLLNNILYEGLWIRFNHSFKDLL